MSEYCPSCGVHRGHRANCPEQWRETTPFAVEKPDYSLEAYRRFIAAKCPVAQEWGFPIEPGDVHPWLKPHQREGVIWGVRGGRRALFESFGLGKTVQQLEILRLILAKVGGRGLIVAPLGVWQEFKHDAAQIDLNVRFVQSTHETTDSGIYVTNYESVREGKLDPSGFTVSSLDEAAILRGVGGVKTFREFMKRFESVPYRFVATATPDPNEYIELAAYAAYLGIMTVSEIKTRFFKRDSTKADNLTLHPHKVDEWYHWLATWALFLYTPSDLGHSDDGYDLPPMEVIYHEVKVDHSVGAEPERDGQGRMFREAMHGVVSAAREKRDTLQDRVAAMKAIIDAEPEKHFILWHDLEPERLAIKKALPGVVDVYGAQRASAKELQKLEQAVVDFAEGRIQHIAAKPSMFGAGVNWQKHCSDAIFVGVGFKFYAFLQALHRIYRFLQTKPVRIHIIYAESEKRILENLLEKWERHKEQTARMREVVREYGLALAAIQSALRKSIGVTRQEVSGENYRLVLNDSVEETFAMADNSVHLVLTSIPFATMYEYSPSFNDFGHCDSNEHFWRQMGFLIPQLLRVLKPGRLCAIHVKDRIVPGGINGLGFQTAYPFHCDCIQHFQRHGFAYMGMKTIVTDVVRENNQTYRLGWTEQCKDGSKMGFGMPEYLLLFRKPPSDNANSYADEPVVKSKERYSRSRWQIDAHGFARSSGNRLLSPEDLDGLRHEQIFKLFRRHSLETVYDFEQHVKLGEKLEAKGILPVTFMLLQPQSWQPDVWTDITRMRTLNGAQSAKGREMHLCPMQFDLAARAIEQWTQPGEVVYDPFSGLGTVPMIAIEKGRFGCGVELAEPYWLDSQIYCRGAEEKRNAPTLFDLIETEAEMETTSEVV